jgi:hypothetical protein
MIAKPALLEEARHAGPDLGAMSAVGVFGSIVKAGGPVVPTRAGPWFPLLRSGEAGARKGRNLS